MFNRRKLRGASLISIIVAVVIIGTGVLLFAYSLRSSRKQAVRSGEYLIAQGYAAELLELFRGHSQAQLKTYLSKNPFEPTPGKTPCAGCTDCNKVPGQPACNTCKQCDSYYLCAHINLLDRKSMSGNNWIGKILNEDPIAKLPPNTVLDGHTDQAKANRFYQVQVVDITDLKRNTDACAKRAKEYALSANERYLITAGVTWVPKNKQNPNYEKDVERVVLTTVLP